MSEEREVEHFNVVIVSEAFFREKWNNRRLEESKCEKRPIEKKANKRENEDWKGSDTQTKQFFFLSCRWKVYQSVISIVDVASFASNIHFRFWR